LFILNLIYTYHQKSSTILFLIFFIIYFLRSISSLDTLSYT